MDPSVEGFLVAVMLHPSVVEPPVPAIAVHSPEPSLVRIQDLVQTAEPAQPVEPSLVAKIVLSQLRIDPEVHLQSLPTLLLQNQ